jgi:hypothetical protein
MHSQSLVSNVETVLPVTGLNIAALAYGAVGLQQSAINDQSAAIACACASDRRA